MFFAVRADRSAPPIVNNRTPAGISSDHYGTATLA